MKPEDKRKVVSRIKYLIDSNKGKLIKKQIFFKIQYELRCKGLTSGRSTIYRWAKQNKINL